VTPQLNLGRAEMNDAVDRFLHDAEDADLAVVYYSGHGMQMGGDSFLIPVDARIKSERDVRSEAIRLNELMDDLEARRIRHTLLILDACRDNPFRSRTKSTAKGLARPKEMNGAFMVAYATADGFTADDGDGRNGIYTAELLKQLGRPGKNLRDVLEDTQLAVESSSNGLQRPKTYGDTAKFRSLYLSSGIPTQRPVEPPITVGSTVKDCDDCPALVVLPAGSFRMGSPDGEPGRFDNEGPVHEVRIGYRLAVGQYEVSRGEFGRFAQATDYKTEAERNGGCYAWDGKEWKVNAQRNWRDPGFAQSDSHPVVCVSWNDAQAYLKWLNGKAPGKGYRLLSEAEWEYAARAGQGDKRNPWGDNADSRDQCTYANGADATAKAQVPGGSGWAVANCTDGHAYTAPGDALRANAFGLQHMQGNAWEWVQDVWHDKYDGAPSDGAAWLSGGDAARRVLRGGSWYVSPQNLRSAFRGRSRPDDRSNITGFRIARTF
jgi:formylglycine-generating enzyme required for sulfatase activity